MTFDKQFNEWSPIDDFPCSLGCKSKGPWDRTYLSCYVEDLSSSIYWYASISISDAYIILGGTNNGVDSSNSITKYENDDWSYVGTLHHSRQQHSAIFNGREIMIIGGQGSEAEVWDKHFSVHRSLKLKVSGLKPKVPYYNQNCLNPVLFMVPYNFEWKFRK